MRYIRQVHVEHPGTSNEHISHIHYSVTVDDTLYLQSREEAVRSIDSGGESYRSHNDRTGDEATVDTRSGSRGNRYIATVSDGRESNNLLSLPRF